MNTPRQKRSINSLSTTVTMFTGALLAICTLTGILLHACGHVATITYLDKWGLDESFSPQAGDLKIIAGYEAIITLGTGLLEDFPWSRALGIFIGIALSIFIIKLPVKRNTTLSDWLNRRHILLKNLLLSIMGSTFGMYLATLCFFVGFFILLLPGYFGERAGNIKALKQQERFLSSASNEDTEFWKSDRRIARGRIVASTDEKFALYDRDFQAVRIISRDGIEARTSIKSLRSRNVLVN